ncbi:MAG TPA: hypothetical protein VML57_16695 [Burkholderiales bacterium]|nr:hypothetical protein [Burkholderiales bacterium]
MNTKSRLEILEQKVAALETALAGGPKPEAASAPASVAQPAPEPEFVKFPMPEPLLLLVWMAFALLRQVGKPK